MVLAIVIVCLYANDALLRFAVKRNPSTRVNYLLNSSPRADGIAVLGSSMIANAISAKDLSTAVQADVIQLAIGGQGLQEQALIWELYLARHRCKVLVLELHDSSLLQGAIPDPMREDRYSVHLDNSIIRRHIVEYCGHLKAMVWRYVPMFAFAEFNSKIGWHDWVDVAKNVPYDVYAPPIYAESKLDFVTLVKQRDKFLARKPSEADPFLFEALGSILRSADIAGIRVILVEPPTFGGEQVSDRATSSTWRQLPELQSLQLAQFSTAAQQDPAMFDDARHASEQGSIRFTKELAAAINSRPDGVILEWNPEP